MRNCVEVKEVATFEKERVVFSIVPPRKMSNLRFAVVGDVHGDHWAMIRLLSGWEKSRKKPFDFVLQVGDFEPHRDEADLATMAAPAKYRELGDFPAFARGDAEFPWPVYFIGGNHEPYGFLDALSDGSHVTPNCCYIGRANLIETNGLRVAGLSGIFQPQLFNEKRPDISQFGQRSNKDWIGWNEGDIEKLLGLGRADIFLLHEWPVEFGEEQRHFADVAAWQWIELALQSLQPKLVFCGHLHTRLGSVARVGGAKIPVECLAQVARGRDGFAIYEWENDEWREVV